MSHRIVPKTIALTALLASTAWLSGCAFMAVQTAPAKAPATARTEAALRADSLFWQTLHSGDYDGIPRAMQAVKAAYLQSPTDATTAAHVGFLHIWALSESARVATPSPSITDHAVLSRKYFQEAVSLNPGDARFKGFLGATLATEGAIHKDEKISRQGYFTLMDAVDAWPEFNLFTAGYVLSTLPAESPRFREALEYQWRTLDECAETKVDRKQASFTAYMGKQTTEGKKRACWNSWIAPHNFEGFFLNMGDMVTKSGDWQTAQKLYANARLSPDYAQWKFRDTLEARITGAQANVSAFNKPRGQSAPGDAVLMGNSTFSCMACHQK